MIKKSSTIYCIKSYKEKYTCTFIKGKTYKATYLKDENMMYLIDDENRRISFKKDSGFNSYTIGVHFIDLNLLRKQKLEKLKICQEQ